MKFSTVAASAVLFGSMVMAMPPQSVVYETEVVTITSCAPEVTDCPYRTTVEPVPETTPEKTPCTTEEEVEATPTPYPYPVPSDESEPTYAPHPTYEPEPTYKPEPETTPCSESTSIYTPVTYPNTTAPLCPGGYGCPEHTTATVCYGYGCPVHTDSPVPECPGGYGCPPIPTGTGVPYPPANTSTPSVPYPPPVENQGGAAKLAGSFVAVLGVAALALFA